MGETKTERADAWQPEEDQLLADTVIAHIRSGSSQLNAFQEVGQKLGRTAGACGFRWNSTVRKQYEQQIKEAKEEKKRLKSKDSAVPERKQPVMQALIHATGEVSPLNQMIQLAEQAKMTISNMAQQIKSLEQQIESLERENELLKRRLSEQLDTETMSEDAHNLIELLKRARELGILTG